MSMYGVEVTWLSEILSTRQWTIGFRNRLGMCTPSTTISFMKLITVMYWECSHCLNGFRACLLLVKKSSHWKMLSSRSVKLLGNRWTAEDSRHEEIFVFSFSQRPNQPWGPPSLLCIGYPGLFLWKGKSAGASSWPLTSGAEVKDVWSHSSTPPHLPSWRHT
jgi:hypothetical protein